MWLELNYARICLSKRWAGCRGSGVPPGLECSGYFGGSAILAIRRALTGNRGEYLRVVGIHSDGWTDRDISLVCYPFQIITVFPTRPNGQMLHFGDEGMLRWPPEVSWTGPNAGNSWHTTQWVNQAKLFNLNLSSLSRWEKNTGIMSSNMQKCNGWSK